MKYKLKEASVKRIVRIIEQAKERKPATEWISVEIIDEDFDELPDNEPLVLTKSQLTVIHDLVWNEMMSVRPGCDIFKNLEKTYEKIDRAICHSKE